MLARKIHLAAFVVMLVVSLHEASQAQKYKDAPPYLHKALRGLQEQSFRATMDAKQVAQQIRSYSTVWPRYFGAATLPSESLDELRSQMSARERQQAKQTLTEWATTQRRALAVMQSHVNYKHNSREPRFRNQMRHIEHFADLLERELALVDGEQVADSIAPPPDKGSLVPDDPYDTPEAEALASAIGSTRDVAQSLFGIGKRLPGGAQAKLLLDKTLPKLRPTKRSELPEINSPFYSPPPLQPQLGTSPSDIEIPRQAAPKANPANRPSRQGGDLVLNQDGFYSPSDEFEPSPKDHRTAWEELNQQPDNRHGDGRADDGRLSHGGDWLAREIEAMREETDRYESFPIHSSDHDRQRRKLERDRAVAAAFKHLDEIRKRDRELLENTGKLDGGTHSTRECALQGLR